MLMFILGIITIRQT